MRRAPLRLHARVHAARRCFASSTATGDNSSSKTKGLNLTQYVSPLLLRLHPDTIQRHSAALAQENEQAMKQLNQFLELAGAGCNNDSYNARKQVLSMAAGRNDDVEAPIRFPLQFHIPASEQQVEQRDDTNGSGVARLIPVQYVIEISGALVRRTLANSARKIEDPSAAVQTPFAREWQRTTKRILQDLFQIADIPLVVTDADDGTTRSTQLALWLAEEDTPERQHGVHVAKHNRQQHREHEKFDEMFHAMLTKEKNIVFATTTGMEDGPTAQHAVLMSLISERVCLPKLETAEQRQVVFNWIANFLLMHFMELRLHSLVWNKITLLVTVEEDVEKPQVVWDEELPEEGMGVLVPAGMESNELVDFLYEHVEALEAALARKLKVQARHARSKSRQQTHNQDPSQKRKQKSHFYSSEVAAMFRKS